MDTNTIDRECSATFLFAVDGIDGEQDAKTLMKRVQKSVNEQYGDRLMSIEQGDNDFKNKSAVFYLDYGYSEDVPVIKGYDGNYKEPPEPDEYDMVDADDKALDMGKELKKVFEDLGYTVVDWAIHDNRVEDDIRLDDKRFIRDLVERVNSLDAGMSHTEQYCGKHGLKIKITKDPDFVRETEDEDGEYNLADIEVWKGPNFIGSTDDVPFEEVEYALDEIFKGTARVNQQTIEFSPAASGLQHPVADLAATARIIRCAENATSLLTLSDFTNFVNGLTSSSSLSNSAALSWNTPVFNISLR